MAAPIEYADAAPEVRAVYDDIKQTRQMRTQYRMTPDQ